MISDERKQALIEGAFYQAECLNELRWLNSQFALVLNALPLRAQFQLSGVLESRVLEFEQGVSDEEVPACTGLPPSTDDADAGLRTASGDQGVQADGPPSEGSEPQGLSGGGG